MRFAHEMRCIGLDFTCGAAYLICVALSTAADPEEEKDRGRKGRLVLRAYCLLTVAFFLYLGKAALLPSNAIQFGYIWQYTRIMNFSVEPNTIAISRADSFKISRGGVSGDNQLIDEIPIYFKTKKTVSYRNQEIFSFNLNEFDTGVGAMAGCRNHIRIKKPDDIEANVHKGGLITWVEGNEVRHITLEDLPTAEKDDILTVICIDMLSKGDLGFFEYGLDYMMKYEPELMMMYIERYAAGKFTEQEETGDYNTEYIQRLAVNALEEME